MVEWGGKEGLWGVPNGRRGADWRILIWLRRGGGRGVIRRGVLGGFLAEAMKLVHHNLVFHTIFLTIFDALDYVLTSTRLETRERSIRRRRGGNTEELNHTCNTDRY